MDAYERVVTRRELLRRGIAAGVAAVWMPRGLLWGWSQGELPATPTTTPGPFYPVIKPPDRDGAGVEGSGRLAATAGQAPIFDP